MLKTFSGHRASQNEWELNSLLALLNERNVRRYLEIGARDGDTWYDVSKQLDQSYPGEVTVAVDMPGGRWGYRESVGNLRRALKALRASAHNAHIFLGSSQATDVIAAVTRHGPYDAILIDGDHRYEGVKADWEIYRPMAPMIIFHDIAGHGVKQRSSGDPVEVPRLWAEIKMQYDDTREFIAPDSHMGIGVVINPNWRSPL